MARNRMLNPEFWLDEEMASVSPQARLLFMGLWGICDDNHATLPNKPNWIKIQVFPFEQVNVIKLLDELSSIGKIIKFNFDGNEFWWIKNFFKYQKVDRPSKPKYPQFTGVLIKNTKTLDEPSTSPRTEEKRREENYPTKVGSEKKNMKTFNIETGEYEEEIKGNKRKEVIELAKLFDKMATNYSGVKIITPKSYFIILNAMKKHGIKSNGITQLLKDWFSNPNIKDKDKVKLNWALGSNNINEWKTKI